MIDGALHVGCWSVISQEHGGDSILRIKLVRGSFLGHLGFLQPTGGPDCMQRNKASALLFFDVTRLACSLMPSLTRMVCMRIHSLLAGQSFDFLLLMPFLVVVLLVQTTRVLPPWFCSLKIISNSFQIRDPYRT
jgi:hypothetical protein